MAQTVWGHAVVCIVGEVSSFAVEGIKAAPPCGEPEQLVLVFVHGGDMVITQAVWISGLVFIGAKSPGFPVHYIKAVVGGSYQELVLAGFQ